MNNLKTVALALVAFFAVSAASVSVAHACEKCGCHEHKKDHKNDKKMIKKDKMKMEKMDDDKAAEPDYLKDFENLNDA